MDLSKIKIYLSQLKNITKIFRKFKEVFKLPYAKTYFFSSIILILIFVIITFPYDAVILQGIKSLEKSAVKSITIDNINFGFFGSSEFRGINIILPDNDDIKIEELKIDPLKPISIYMSKKIKTDLRINKLTINSKQANISLDLVSNIDLELNKKTLQAENGTLNFLISKLIVKLGKLDLGPELSMLKLPEKFSFKSINLRSQLSNKNLQITNLKILGSEITGSITGSINIHNMFNNSRLNLTIKIDSKSNILAEFKDILKGMKYIHSDGNIIIQISGLVSRPKVSIKKSDSSPDSGGTSDVNINPNTINNPNQNPDRNTDNNKRKNRKERLNALKNMRKNRHIMMPDGKAKKGFEEYRDPNNKKKDDD